MTEDGDPKPGNPKVKGGGFARRASLATKAEFHMPEKENSTDPEVPGHPENGNASGNCLKQKKGAAVKVWVSLPKLTWPKPTFWPLVFLIFGNQFWSPQKVISDHLFFFWVLWASE